MILLLAVIFVMTHPPLSGVARDTRSTASDAEHRAERVHGDVAQVVDAPRRDRLHQLVAPSR